MESNADHRVIGMFIRYQIHHTNTKQFFSTNASVKNYNGDVESNADHHIICMTLRWQMHRNTHPRVHMYCISKAFLHTNILNHTMPSTPQYAHVLNRCVGVESNVDHHANFKYTYSQHTYTFKRTPLKNQNTDTLTAEM